MENVHNAIAWYQTKIGSYDKQLWEQSVEKKLQKQPPFVLDNAPRKKVRHKTEYIDVDLIRGSTFTKTKPQVPWVYITRKAIARVLFFPFYYNWWVHQTSRRLYGLLLVLYVLQVATVIVYLRNFDHSVMEDELCFTEVVLPAILMFLLCLIHSQTVLAHINHKPPKRNKNISGVTRKPRPKKASRKGRSSGNNSTCQEDGANTDTSRSSRRRAMNQHTSDTNLSTVSDAAGQKNQGAPVVPTIDMEKNLMSRSVSDYELKPATNVSQAGAVKSASSLSQQCYRSLSRSGVHATVDASHVCSRERACWSGVREKWREGSETFHKPGYKYSVLDNSPNLLTVEKVYCDDDITDEALCCGRGEEDGSHIRRQVELQSQDKCQDCWDPVDECVAGGRVGSCSVGVSVEHCRNACTNTENKSQFSVCSVTSSRSHPCFYKVASKSPVFSRTHRDIEPDVYNTESPDDCRDVSKSVANVPAEGVPHIDKDKHTLGHEVSYDCSVYPDNLAVSGFEMVEQLPERRNLFLHDVPPSAQAAGSTDQASSSGGPHSSGSAMSELDPRMVRSLRAISRPFKSQDSADSGINNEVPAYVDCLCPGSHQSRDNSTAHQCSPRNKWQTDSTSGVEDFSIISSCVDHGSDDNQEAELTFISHENLFLQESQSNGSQDSASSVSDSSQFPTVKANLHPYKSTKFVNSHQVDLSTDKDEQLQVSEADLQTLPHTLVKDCQLQVPTQTLPHISVSSAVHRSQDILVNKKDDQQSYVPLSESSSQLQCFSELFVQEILNDETLREMSCSSLLVHSDLENSSSSVSHLSTASSTSSNLSSGKRYSSESIPISMTSSSQQTQEPSARLHRHHQHHHHHHHVVASPRQIFQDQVKINASLDDDRDDALDESLEHINISDGERPSDDVSNYNPSDSDADSDGLVDEDLCSEYEEKWKKRLRFQDLSSKSEGAESVSADKVGVNVGCGFTAGKAALNGSGGGGSRSVVGILTRKPSPLKDLAIGRKSGTSVPVTNSSGSDQGMSETHNQLRRRRRTSGTPTEPADSTRSRSVPTTLGLHSSDAKSTHLSSSENETGGARTPEGSNKATMSSEEWEDRMQSDESTSSAYSSNSEVDSEERAEEEEKTEYTTSTLHVINLLQPQSGSPSSSGTLTQPDRVSCMIWEGNECKKVDLTALDIGWAIIDKVDSLPESSDYFLIGFIFSLFISMVPLVFRAYASKESLSLEEFLSWSGLVAKFLEIPALISSPYSWRQYLLMVNGILQRFFLSLIFFFLLSVADRTFKQRLLYAKHFSYLTSSRRARKFSMPHFRLNKVRNIKIWLSLRSYLKRRGPQRSVDVIVSACFLCAVCAVCLISLQMLKDTTSYLDYLCNWELLVWCTALAVFLMRFMTVGLKINKKYRNLSVLITEQINLYLQMEQKPHKKEELILANNVLRLAEDLLKELESPFKISGFSANPLIYNIMRVVVLSAFSAVLTEVLGFKLKLHKIKLKG